MLCAERYLADSGGTDTHPIGAHSPQVSPEILPHARNLVPWLRKSLAPAGGDQPHNNMMPYLTFNFNIALQGVFPPRG